MLRDARVRSILPGIESFSNKILRMMRKGSTGLQNLQILRWSMEFGIDVIWSFLYGFPGEPEAEYEQLAAFVPLVVHLQPPSYCIPVQLDRFSPYFNQSAAFGLTNVRPAAAYRYIYPLPDEQLRNLAYFFDFDLDDPKNPAEYARSLIQAVEGWSNLHRCPPEDAPRLDLYQSLNSLLISDTRPSAVRPFHVLDGLAAQVYLLCDSVQTVNILARKLTTEVGDIRAILDRLVRDLLVVEMEDQYISLAVMRNRAEVREAAEQAAEAPE
jgi:hypothetical protein